MSKILIPVLAFAMLGACIATHERSMNAGEKTLVSDEVLAMVEENDGSLDIREHDNVRCERLRLVGTHMVTRLCYTTEEEKKMAEESRKKYYGRFGAPKCLDQSSASCQGGLLDPGG